MAIPVHPSVFVWLGIAALVVWRLYARMRQMVGRQALTPVRPWLTVTLFPLLLALLAALSAAYPWSLVALAAGALLGAGLGRYGLSLTKFEPTPQGLFYTPNAPLGLALFGLLVLRLAWRFGRLYFAAKTGDIDAAGLDPESLHRSPLTLLVFGTLAGYYVAYAAGLLRWKARVTAG